MLPEEIRRKVQWIEITTRRLVDDVMSGSYKSHFKGHGVQFSEHRTYVAGDDVRHIDWKVSARSKDVLVKKYEEERELTVFLVVDISHSEGFGSREKLKSEVLAELSGMLASAAIRTGDKVGVLLFAGDIERIIPPKKGKQHILRIIREVLGFRAKTSGTHLKEALESAGRIMKHSGIIFVLSDFLAEDYELPLKRLARKHDVVAISVGDPREKSIPNIGQILVQDPETGVARMIDTGSYAFQEWLGKFTQESAARLTDRLKWARIELLEVKTDEDYPQALMKFFQARSRLKARGPR